MMISIHRSAQQHQPVIANTTPKLRSRLQKEKDYFVRVIEYGTLLGIAIVQLEHHQWSFLCHLIEILKRMSGSIRTRITIAVYFIFLVFSICIAMRNNESKSGTGHDIVI